jgi:hypothetical protein
VEGEQLLLDTVRKRTGEPVDAILDDLFAAPDLPTDVPADDRTAVLVRIG